MNKFFRVLPIIFLFGNSTCFALSAVVNPVKVEILNIRERITSLEMIKQVRNQITQIQQLQSQITIANAKNAILGDYEIEGLEDIAATVESYQNLTVVEDLESMLESIKSQDFDAEEFFNETLEGALGNVESPKEVYESKYKSHDTYEKAYNSSVATQKRLNEANVKLAEEAKSEREKASSSVNQAEYTRHTDKALAAEKAIKRNQDEIELAIKNAGLIKRSSEAHGLKVEKSAQEVAMEEEMEVFNKLSEEFNKTEIRTN